MATVTSISGRLRDLLMFRLVPPTYLGLNLNLRPMSSSAQDASRAAPSKASDHNYESLRVTAAQRHVLHVELNRPEKRNAMNKAFWREMVECFNKIAQDADCRAVVISGRGKVFSAGIDFMDLGADLFQSFEEDVARISWHLRNLISSYQETFSVIEKCPKPVIAAIHGSCVGGGVDLITACDIRYCAQDAFFQVKEVDLGLAADVGTLQRLPRVIGNQSRVFPDKEATFDAALALAAEIATKSPVAVQGTKVNLLYSRDHSVAEGLNHMASWNMSMLQSQDIKKSFQAMMEKKKLKTVTFSKL
uniref:Delta(3,5)-Delta(2,4)-dienoyl-CoA isomerase, mitochondrial n=1 Tax=Rousettus aegyptiacus TaxID=9407 RepID=A0A7J8CFP2_ROUAE|nr:enoyl-CoA hydratase 1 [Rousettus aegyptiacus]